MLGDRSLGVPCTVFRFFAELKKGLRRVKWSSGKDKVYEVLSGQDLSLAVAGALLASL